MYMQKEGYEWILTLLLLFKLGLQFIFPLAMGTTYAIHEQNIYNWITAIFRQKEF